MSISKPFVYRSSNNHLYYLHGGEDHSNGLKIYTFSENSENALNSPPSSHVIVERQNSENAPALVSKRHTREDNHCQWEKILDVAEQCDAQFHLSGIGDPQWNKRRRSTITKMIAELENMRKTVTCSECQKEIKWQIDLQGDSIGKA